MALINRIEYKSDVHLRYMGVDCWPIVRNSFMTMVSHGVVKRTKKLSTAAYLSAFFDFIYLLFKVDKAHALVLTDDKYQAEIHGKLYYKDASVIKELLNDSEKKCHILIQSASSSTEDDKQAHSVFFFTALAVLLAKIMMALDYRKLVDRYLQNICNSVELESLGSNVQKNFRQIKINIYFVIVASFLFQLLLRRIRPKKCFIVCYYSCLGMALCVACRRLGIESIDLQHGVSGSNMRAYGQWSNLPTEALNTLPQSFYCWTMTDVSAINFWLTNKHYYKAFLTGNIWHQYLVEKNHLRLSEESVLASKVERYRKVVLYTARTADLPKLILDFLKQAPSDYFFIIRMHPDIPIKELFAISEKMKTINSSCSVINATKSRIPICVRLADIHITEWSAAVYDAYFEQTPSIVISEVGRDYFEDFISQGFVVYCNDLNSIIKKIEEPFLKEKYSVKLVPIRKLKKIVMNGIST